MVKEQSIVQQILEMITTLLEASEYLLDTEYTDEMVDNMMEMLERMREAAVSIEEEEPNTRIHKACESALYSLYNLTQNEYKRNDKLMYEFMPILEEMYTNLYFFGCVYPHEDEMAIYYEGVYKILGSNEFINKAVREKKFKYDVSISVTGYNKLEYTKMCVEHLLKHIPKGLKYELILYNHGSDDGTKAYFESLGPTKQVDIKVNGAVPYIITRIVEGRYHIHISNDVLVMKNTIDNMIKCMKSNSNIKYAVPSTPHVSNLQGLPIKYANFEELEAFVEENNEYDEYKHEQRTRLINPLEIVDTEVMYSEEGVLPYAFLHIGVAGAGFGDDKKSLFLRRKGHKMVLLKDAYCFHYGSVTLKDEVKKVETERKVDFYLEGRKNFYKYLQVDPWGKGFCYDLEMLELIEDVQVDGIGGYSVLGINCGMGSNPLKVKSYLREKNRDDSVYLYNITEDERVLEDLKGISDDAIFVPDLSKYENKEGVKFHYIVIESDMDLIQIDRIRNLYIGQNGVIVMAKTSYTGSMKQLEKVYQVTQNTKWMMLTR